MLSIRFVLITAIALAWSLPVQSEEMAAARQGKYRIGNPDVLEVGVFGESELSGSHTVDADGRITLPLIGDVAVTGLTTTEVAELIERLYRDGYLIAPKVTVAIAAYKSQVVVVLGDVTTPGSIAYTEGLTALRAVLQAGNFTESADPNLTQIVRGSGDDRETFDVRLGDVMSRGSTVADVPLQPGDYVFVESGSAVVFVLGQVMKPGTVPFHEGLTALRAVLEAEGFTKYAAANKTRVVRGEGDARETIRVKLGDVINKGETAKDVVLQSGDFVIVPEGFF